MTALLRLVLLAAAVAAAAPAAAGTVRLRSGDHGDFTRLVADLAPGTTWHFGRTETGYAFRGEDASTTFDTGAVFHKIGRARVSGVSAGPEPASFAIDLACDCHATVTALDSGAVVIDVADGPAPQGSPYELPFGDGDSPPLQAAPPDAPEGADARAAAAFARQGPAPAVPPHLDVFWKAVPAGPAPSQTATSVKTAATSDATSEPDPVQVHPTPLALPGARVAAAEDALLHDLGRAASQGLIEIDLPRPGTAEPKPPAQAPDQPASDATAAHMGVHTETSIDRGAVRSATRSPVTATGGTCLPDKDLDIAAWGDDRPAALQIAEARTALVGEFDRPDHARVMALARLYLHFGFGAEARATLAAFGEDGEAALTLAGMGAIVDGHDAGAGFAPMMSCDGFVALWALLSAEEVNPSDPIKPGAVVRAFSALPLPLRHTLGHEVVRRLSLRHEALAADAIRDALARTTEPGDQDLDLLAARIDLENGRPDEAEKRLVALAETNMPRSVEALMMLLESKLARGETVPPGLTASAEALAFERRAGTDGPALHRLAILSRSAAGNFDAAFQGLSAWPESTPEEMRKATVRGVFAALAKAPDDAALLRGYTARRDLFDASDPDLVLRLDLGDRLVAAGVSGPAREVLAGEAAHTERGRRILARAAMLDLDPGAALAALGGLDGAEAATIRADAQALAGEHATAASAYGVLGDSARAAREAWRAGDLREAMTGTDNLAKALQRLRAAKEEPAPLPDPPPPADAAAHTAPQGPLAAARDLVATSRSTRDALRSVLAASGG
ncbi:MAG: hypothetical protein KDE00_04890 [Rhodobacteraceae bacterium]|nr:hypothetical protein [Paracoccaceae bacterium]